MKLINTPYGARFFTGALVSAAIALSGCSTWNKLDNQEKGAVIGAGTGAVIGNTVSSGVGGTVVGGAVGGLGGGLIGREMDKEDEREYRRRRGYYGRPGDRY